MSGSVFRVVASRGFTTLQNETVNDRRLSPEALGVLCRLAGKPVAWDIQAANIEKENNIGKDKRRRIFNELEGAGYARRFRTQTGKGQWIQVTEIYVVSRKPAEGGFSGVGKSAAGSTGDGKPSHIVKNINKKTVNKKQPLPAGGGGEMGWPAQLAPAAREACERELDQCPPDLQPDIVRELSHRLRLSAGRGPLRMPWLWVRALVRAAQTGALAKLAPPAPLSTEARKVVDDDYRRRLALSRERGAAQLAATHLSHARPGHPTK